MSFGRLRSLACLLGLLSAAPHAAASAAFPEAMRQELGLEAVPPPAPGCRVCHRDDAGGLRTVTTPFGRSMLAAGTTAVNVSTVVASLRALDADATDSDGDGVGDIAELAAGTDPNAGQSPDGSPPLDPVPLPQTGCSLRGAVAPGGGGFGVFLGLLWLSARTRRR